MHVVGITGSLGTGKTTVAKIFAGFGAKVLDADRIAHRQMRPGTACFQLIVNAFGKEFDAGKGEFPSQAVSHHSKITNAVLLQEIGHQILQVIHGQGKGSGRGLPVAKKVERKDGEFFL